MNVREFTEEEVREKFLQHCWVLIDYWENVPNKSMHDKMVGLVFSILVSLDGESAGLPAVLVAPIPHPDDKEFLIREGESWFPENDERLVNCNIAGSLHDLLISHHFQETNSRL